MPTLDVGMRTVRERRNMPTTSVGMAPVSEPNQPGPARQAGPTYVNCRIVFNASATCSAADNCELTNEPDDSFLVDHVGHAAGQNAEALRHAEGLAQAPVGVAKQHERQPMMLGERLMARGRVGTYADHDRAGFDEIFVRVAEAARLLGADRRLVLRIKEEHDRVFLAIISQRD
jgi:hypothetical protein